MALLSFPAQVNERAARLVAGAVAVSLVGAWVAGWVWVIPVLGLGFLLRWGWGPRFSPLGRTAARIAPRLWEARLVAGAPKRSAQGIGAFCMLCASALFLAGWATVAWGVAGVVAVFATLEGGLGFCAGCWLYGHVLQQRGQPALCEDCVVPRRSKPAADPAGTTSPGVQ